MRSLPFVVVTLIATPALAADSTWLLCKGIAEVGKPATKVHLAISAFEHRDPTTGADRGLDVTILRGSHVSRAMIKKLETGKPIKFSAKPIAGSVPIAGKLTLSIDMTKLTITGTLDKDPLTATFTCETLDDLAIGH